MSWNNSVQVNIYSGAPAVGQAQFGIPLHFTDGASFAAVLVKSYTSAAEVNADSELDAATKALVAQAFNASPKPPVVKVGKATASYADVTDDLNAIIAEDNDWFSLDCASRTEAVILEIAAWAETVNKIYIAQSSDAAILAATAGNVAEDLQGLAYNHTALIYHATDTEAAALVWQAQKDMANPDYTATIWRYANLSGISVDVLDSTEHDNCVDQECNTYEYFASVGATGKGVMASGKPIDQVVSELWLQARIQEAVSQLLLDRSSFGQKIPYSNVGIATFVGVISGVITRGRPRDDGGIGHFRYYADGKLAHFTVPDITNIALASIEDRKLIDLKVSVLLSGAIEELVLPVYIQLTE